MSADFFFKINFFKKIMCMLGNFSCFCCRSLTFFKINFFKKFLQELYQSLICFGSKFNQSQNSVGPSARLEMKELLDGDS